MAKSRLSHWQEPVELITFLAGDNKSQLDYFSKLQSAALENGDHATTKVTQTDFIRACRELIFDSSGPLPKFHAIAASLNTDRIAITFQLLFEILITDDQSQMEIDEDVCNTLAMATAYGIPVYPNVESDVPSLMKYHRQMLIDGFLAPDGKGNRVRLKLTKSPGHQILDPSLINRLDPTEMVTPADLLLMREALATEMAHLSGAQRVVHGIRQAIAELELLLQSPERNENSIQRCLTLNPILFGPEYFKIIPKHRLGSEYEMDYALENYSGLVDLVEIESSSLPLFNKRGDPSSHLVHAEQQVIDWLSWIEQNNPYARQGLPSMADPKGFVIIGRSNSMGAAELTRLRRRNAMFNPRITILTYDQLLDRARQILKIFESVGK